MILLLINRVICGIKEWSDVQINHLKELSLSIATKREYLKSETFILIMLLTQYVSNLLHRLPNCFLSVLRKFFLVSPITSMLLLHFRKRWIRKPTHLRPHFIWYLTLSWRRPLSYRNQSNDLLCIANQCTGFSMIKASFMKEFRVAGAISPEFR